MQYPKKHRVLVLLFALHAVFGSWDGWISFPHQVCITIHTMVAVVLHEDVSRKIAQSTTLCTVLTLIYGISSYWVIPCQVNTKKSLPPPILLKFGELVRSIGKLFYTKFQLSRSNSFWTAASLILKPGGRFWTTCHDSNAYIFWSTWCMKL